MTQNQLQIAFSLAEAVYLGNKTLKEAKECGCEYGINPGSMQYFCTAFRHMMKGTRQTASIPADLREYFLSRIFIKYDQPVRANALKAFEQTILYDEERNRCTQHKNRAILSKYRHLL